MGSGQKMFVKLPAVVPRHVGTMMLVEQKMSRQSQLRPFELANVMDWLQKSTTPQAWPIQEAVMTGQLVTMDGRKRVTGLVQQKVLVQVGVGNDQLVVLQATT